MATSSSFSNDYTSSYVARSRDAAKTAASTRSSKLPAAVAETKDDTEVAVTGDDGDTGLRLAASNEDAVVSGCEAPAVIVVVAIAVITMWCFVTPFYGFSLC